MLSPYRFDVDDYHRMGEAGILSADSRVELLDGQIVSKPVIGSRHNSCVMALTQELVRVLLDRAMVAVQGPVRLGRYSEPEPDLSLLRPREDRYASRHPGIDDTFLVIEVADTSLVRDRRIKLPLYALAGIPEYWIVDLTTNAVERHREPEGETYRLCERVTEGEVAPLAFPDLRIDLGRILPGPAEASDG